MRNHNVKRLTLVLIFVVGCAHPAESRPQVERLDVPQPKKRSALTCRMLLESTGEVRAMYEAYILGVVTGVENAAIFYDIDRTVRPNVTYQTAIDATVSACVEQPDFEISLVAAGVMMGLTQMAGQEELCR